MDLTLVSGILRREEAFVPHAYPDHLGYWTIGYGTLIDRKAGGGITEDEASYLMLNRIRSLVGRLAKLPFWERLDYVRRSILVAMAYQLGFDGLMKFKWMLAAVAAEQWDRAADEMLNSLWHKQTPERAERMAAAMRAGRMVS